MIELGLIQIGISNLSTRIAALEASDSTQAGEIQTLQTELAALKARVAEIEAIPSIRNKLGN